MPFFGQDPGGVTIRFDDGSTAGGDVLIGADGLHSVVRAGLGHKGPVRYAGYRAWQAHVLSLFKGWHEPIEALIRASSDAAILRHDIYDRDVLKTWSRGRVTLLGDAAHTITPNLGQGGCQAIEDAMELATALKGASDVETALRKYESRRTARTTSIVLASRRMGRLGQIDSSFVCRLRDLALQLTPNNVTLRTLAPVVGYERHLDD